MTLHAYTPLADQEIANLARQALEFLAAEEGVQDLHVIWCWMHGMTQRQTAATCPRMDGGKGLTGARVRDIRTRAIRRLKYHMGLRYEWTREDGYHKIGPDADAFAPMPDAVYEGRLWR